jgi:hypothetical protein
MDQMPDPLLRSKWNFAAITAVFVLLVVNMVAGAGFLMGTVTWQDWLTATGALNGIALGWVSKTLSSS